MEAEITEVERSRGRLGARLAGQPAERDALRVASGHDGGGIDLRGVPDVDHPDE